MSSREVVIIPAQTAAVATAVSFDAEEAAEVVLTAFGLAGVEAIQVLTLDRNSAASAEVFEDGAALELTATKPQVVLAGGVKYGFTKDATAAAAKLVANVIRG